MGWRGILGFEYGIVQAPLGPDISGPQLVAAVADAGALGLLRAPDWECPDYLRELIRKTRTLTDKPFGIGVVLAFPHEENLKVILEEKVAVLQVYWGDCTRELVDKAHNAGVKVVPQVGSVKGAKQAIDAEVDGIIVQGREAGGHVIGQDGLISLVPRVVDLVADRDIPVIAAGGIVDARGYVAALALGAQGVCLGTRFVATEESYAHPTYKRKLLEIDETEYTDIFGRARWPGAPQRVLQTPFYKDWRSLPAHENESNQPLIGHSTIHGMEKETRRFAGTVPNLTATGDIESMAMYAGQGVGLIKEILPAGEVVKGLVEGAQLLIQRNFNYSCAVAFSCFQSRLLLLLLLLLLFFNNARCGNIVNNLPGFEGPLPFKLETGYIRVEESELFYYFVESTGKPRIDPLLLYLVGGPGCSGLNGLFYQTGPLAFNGTDYSGGLPQLSLRPYPWTKTASIIFPDVPVGTGFSYATTQEGYMMSDTISARQTSKFLRKWLIEHPEYILNRVYITTDSYSGLLGPIITQHVLDSNAAGLQPYINLIGILSDSPHTSTALEHNSRVPYARNMALISDKFYEAAKESCNGWYYEVDPLDAKCVEALEPIAQCLGDIYEDNVLEPNCALISPKPDDELARRALKEAEHFLHPSLKHIAKDWQCKIFVYLLSFIWANDKTVQEALHVREGTFDAWSRCNLTLNDMYYKDIDSVIPYHQNLAKTGLQVLIYTGDLDMVIPHISTEYWLRFLNLIVDYSWTPWFVDGQVAGYRVVYSNTRGYRLTYATVKGAGHSPTEYFHERCFQMFERWIHFYPL